MSGEEEEKRQVADLRSGIVPFLLLQHEYLRDRGKKIQSTEPTISIFLGSFYYLMKKAFQTAPNSSITAKRLELSSG